ncbi:hypothetical protein EGW08_017589 [Elysia chlorotica]|uniref:Uncharacterized protein n=1 Tax=Elysia chlorotica TaxID=188477 RepID=A0A3S1BTR3_ELYCH|nr:hypothetical protein EGW08_017589 [Elysia chlorotica]
MIHLFLFFLYIYCSDLKSCYNDNIISNCCSETRKTKRLCFSFFFFPRLQKRFPKNVDKKSENLFERDNELKKRKEMNQKDFATNRRRKTLTCLIQHEIFPLTVFNIIKHLRANYNVNETNAHDDIITILKLKIYKMELTKLQKNLANTNLCMCEVQ